MESKEIILHDNKGMLICNIDGNEKGLIKKMEINRETKTTYIIKTLLCIINRWEKINVYICCSDEYYNKLNGGVKKQ